MKATTLLLLSLCSCTLPDVSIAPNDAGSETTAGAAVVPLRLQFAQWPMPDAMTGAKAAPMYEPSGSTVEDRITHLVWQRELPDTYQGCSGRQHVSGDSCTWQQAHTYCSELDDAGDDWRLPTKIELESIVDATRKNPAIDAAFSTPPSAAGFWTASSYAGATGYAWHVDFSDGLSDYFDIRAPLQVRCVRDP
ncbi:MAG TPA: DUF1566 domain-containing protein [Polyangiales bacterium]|nr:DUF1566 domain-containing protein [Polyangiales bacterium]